jgi:hypothetical protein
MPRNLSETLTELKRIRRRQLFVKYLCRFVMANLLFALIAFGLDNLTGLSPEVRLFGLLIWGFVNIVIMVRLLVESVKGRMNDKQAAMELEKTHGIKDNSLVNAVCFSKDESVSENIRKLFTENADSKCSRMKIPGIFNSRNCRRAVLGMLVILLIALLYMVPFYRYAGNALLRFANPWTQLASLNFTQFRVMPGDILVPEGSSVKLSAEAFRDGQRRNSLKVLIKSSSAPVVYSMKHDGGKSVFELSNISGEMKYSIQSGKDSSREFVIKVKKRPQFEKFKVTVDAPAYTGLEKRVYGIDSREITVPAGSQVSIDGTVPGSVTGLKLSGGKEASALPCKFAVDQDMSAEAFIQADGIKYDNVWNCAFKVRADTAPQVRFLNRDMNVEAGLGETVPLYFSADDDYGISRLVVTITEKGRTAVLKTFDYGNTPRKQVREAFALRIDSRIFLPDGSAEIKVVAVDNHKPFQSAVTSSPVTIHFIDLIRKFSENADMGRRARLYKLLMNALNRQQYTRGWLAVAVKKLHRWQGFRLHSEQRVICRVVAQAQKESEELLKVKLISENYAKNIGKINKDYALQLQDMSLKMVRRKKAENDSAELNRILAVQTGLIKRIQELLGIMAVDRRQEIVQKKTAKEEAEEKELYDKLKQVRAKMDEFLKSQRKIIKQTEAVDPKKADDWSEKEEKLLGDLAAKQADWAKFFKAAFNDLSKLQNQDFSNSAMADEFVEMYEELQKAGDALKKKKIEIATLAENTAMDSAQAVAANLDRWLSDNKDYIKWTAEEDGKAADTDLTDLPSELTDIIGDLIESEDDMGEDTQDSTNSFSYDSDEGLGWGVSDGNIDSMQAKGITGNVLPNNNEVGGRSGEGRSGKSSGQFVEKEATGKGGRKTPTRLTQSPYEKGTVVDKSKDSQGGATGGGKQSGVGDDGLTGVTPDQDPDIAERLAGNQGELRQRMKALMKKLTERNLPTGDLQEALRKLAILGQSGKGSSIDVRRVKSEIVAALRNARTALDTVAVAEHENLKRRRTKTFVVKHHQQEKVPSGYEDYVGSYFKALAAEKD